MMKGDLVEWLMENSSRDNPKRLTEIYEGSGLGADYKMSKVSAYLYLLWTEKRIEKIKIIVDPTSTNWGNYNVYWVE